MSIELLKEKPERRKADQSWNILAKAKNYYKPTTHEEHVEAKKRARLTINGRPWVFLDLSKAELKALVDSIYHDPNLKTLVSRNTVHLQIIKELEQELQNRDKNQKNKRAFSEILERLECFLNEEIGEFEFFFPVEGIALEGIDAVGHGAVELLFCNQSICDQLLSENLGEHSSYSPIVLKSRSETFEQNFLNHVIIKSIAFGDAPTAKKKAYRQAREFINYLRFSLCLLIHERVTEQLVRINLSVEACKDGEIFLRRQQNSNSIALCRGKGQRPLQLYIIDQKKTEQLISGGFLNDFISIAGTSSPTELELCILTAVYWIGEAQNEFNLDVAFIKYWTALECIFSEKDNVTQSLKEGVSKLNAYSQYKFIEVADIKDIQKDVSKLYDKRSDIIHRGTRHIEEEDQGVSSSDISLLCKYAVWSISSLFELRRLNYTTRSQMTERIKGLYPPYSVIRSH
jgi:hypothetical protein